jgi:hypothetical protein
MDDATRLKSLSLALRMFAVVFVVGVYPLTIVWPSGWAWHTGRSEYLEMIMVIYATLGVFLWLIARNPAQHLGLISFTIWSSIAHGGVMALQSIDNPAHRGHLYGDVLALFVVAAVLGWLSPRALTFRFSQSTSARP